MCYDKSSIKSYYDSEQRDFFLTVKFLINAFTVIFGDINFNLLFRTYN